MQTILTSGGTSDGKRLYTRWTDAQSCVFPCSHAFRLNVWLLMFLLHEPKTCTLDLPNDLLYFIIYLYCHLTQLICGWYKITNIVELYARKMLKFYIIEHYFVVQFYESNNVGRKLLICKIFRNGFRLVCVVLTTSLLIWFNMWILL